MKLSEKVAALLNYIQYNPQDNYIYIRSGYEAQGELQELAMALQNGTAETDKALLGRYRKAVDHLVRNYFSNKYISPLMYATIGNEIDLMKDILATPGIDIDKPYNHRTQKHVRAMFFGTYEWVEVNGPEYGYTALVYALKADFIQAAHFLLRHYANPHHPVNLGDDETVIDLFDEEKESENYTFLENAWLLQALYLAEDLINCTSERQLKSLIETQDRLGIGKDPVIDALINFYPDDQDKQIRLLESATDVNERNEAQNLITEYVKTMGALETVNKKLEELAAPSAAPEKPLIKMLSYGPQNPIHPYADKNNHKILVREHDASLNLGL